MVKTPAPTTSKGQPDVRVRRVYAAARERAVDSPWAAVSVSVELIVEVLKYAPADLNPTEKLTLVVIAESCRAETRTTFYREGWDADELARRVGVTAETLTKVFRSLAAKGCEVRVPHMVKNGKPIFAFKGKQTTFLLPQFRPQRVDESPGFTDGEEAKGWTSVRESLDESPGIEAQSLDESPPLLLKDLPSRNTSSLSPREDEPPTAATVPAPRTEREIELTSSSEPKGEEPNPVHRLLLDAGCPEDQLDDVRDWITAGNSVNGFGWWVTVNGRGHLAAIHVPDALKALGERKAGSGGKPPWCGHCDERTRQRTTEWMENVSISRCPECHPLVVRDDKQPRTEERDPSFRPSRAAAAARQGLAVADRLDRENGHGIYAPRQIRSPADQVVADAEPLHRKYKARETGHKTYSNPPEDAEWGV